MLCADPRSWSPSRRHHPWYNRAPVHMKANRCSCVAPGGGTRCCQNRVLCWAAAPRCCWETACMRVRASSSGAVTRPATPRDAAPARAGPRMFPEPEQIADVRRQHQSTRAQVSARPMPTTC